jgi:hypothetical protein
VAYGLTSLLLSPSFALGDISMDDNDRPVSPTIVLLVLRSIFIFDMFENTTYN